MALNNDIEKIFLKAVKQIKLDASFWNKAGVQIKKLINRDMDQGILQGTKTTDYYRNKKYVELKSNYMNDPATGKKIGDYKGRSVVSNYTASVNMKLTGDLIKGLQIKEATNDYVQVEYKEKDYSKIQDNAKLGRDVANLNTKNRELMTKYVINKIKQNVKSIITENIQRSI